MATITVTPTSPVAKKDAARIDVASASTNRADHSEFRYYLDIQVEGARVGKSYIFNVSSDGKHQFYTYVFPSAGSYSVILKDAVGDGTIATQSVTVQ